MALIKSYRDHEPRWGEGCYFSENASIIGDVVMGRDCSVWFSAVLRGDVAGIRMGDGVNVQDCACIHTATNLPAVLEDRVTVGHGAVVHACTVHRDALIGMNAVVLDGVEIGEGAIVAAGAVVLGGTKVGPYEIWAGVPARRMNKPADAGEARKFADNYVRHKEDYR